MAIVTGGLSRARSLNNIDPAGPLTLQRLVVLLALGAVTVLMHETFRYPLKMPGHHGLEAMAILAFGRLICTDRWAATIVALSAATTGVVFGNTLHDGWPAPALTLVPGVAIDLAVLAWAGWRDKLFVFPLIVAAAFALKPIFRFFGAELISLHFGSLRSGALFPISTHLMYGFAGSLIAVLAWRSWANVAKNSRT